MSTTVAVTGRRSVLEEAPLAKGVAVLFRRDTAGRLGIAWDPRQLTPQKLAELLQLAHDHPEKVAAPCPDCGGTGGRIEVTNDGQTVRETWHTCTTCSGKGVRR